MQNTSYVALSRQMTMARELELVANNIANAETTAYRGERMMFTDFLHDPSDAPKTHFARDVAVVRNLAQGRPIKARGLGVTAPVLARPLSFASPHILL